jgi:hypothetical protein
VNPTHAAGDILLLFVECAESAGVTAPAGWAHVTNSPNAQGSNVTCANVMWKRATTSSETNPTVVDPGNHQIGFVVAVSGAIATGTPTDFAPTTNGQAGVTTFSATGGTLTVTNTRVFVFVASSVDVLTDQFTSVTNASLTGFAIVDQEFTDLGNGGGVGVWSGTKTTTGTTGTATGTIGTSGSYASIVFAIRSV